MTTIPFAQSVLEYGAISGALSSVAGDIRELANRIQSQFFGIAIEIRVLIGLGVIVAVALWARRSSEA